MTTPKNDWEERFDEKFENDYFRFVSLSEGYNLNKQEFCDSVKSFIRAEKNLSFKEGQEDMLRKVRESRDALFEGVFNPRSFRCIECGLNYPSYCKCTEPKTDYADRVDQAFNDFLTHLTTNETD